MGWLCCTLNFHRFSLHMCIFSGHLTFPALTLAESRVFTVCLPPSRLPTLLFLLCISIKPLTTLHDYIIYVPFYFKMVHKL